MSEVLRVESRRITEKDAEAARVGETTLAPLIHHLGELALASVIVAARTGQFDETLRKKGGRIVVILEAEEE